MSSLLSFLTSVPDLLLVIIGFTLIIVVHELGHFLAAKWAGVRVLAFAVGFGPSLVSFRKGLGLRRGSSEAEYDRLRQRGENAGISPTEYRFNALPFGGYVKMLGQDDANPAGTSDEPDSFTTCPVWKRMVIISAGVVMNVLLAAALFIIVFMMGLKVTPPVVGLVAPGSPAALAVPLNAADAGVTESGLQAGDRIVSIDGEPPAKFEDIVLATAMARRGAAVSMTVERPGVETPLRFDIIPRVDEGSRLQMIGLGPAMSTKLPTAKTAADREQWKTFRKAVGLKELEPGMTLVSIDGQAVRTAHDLTSAAEDSKGQTLRASFRRIDGTEVEIPLKPTPAMQLAAFRVDEISTWATEHLLGLAPVLRVAAAGKAGEAAGLREGDVFALLGWVEWPSMPDGIAAIRAHRGKNIRAIVMRPQADGTWSEVDLGELPVNREGQIGFTPRDTSDVGTWVAGWPKAPRADEAGTPSGATLRLLPGTRIVQVGNQPVQTLAEVAIALRKQTAGTPPGEPAAVELLVELPYLDGAAGGGGTARTERVPWTIPADELAALHKLEWRSPLAAADFVPVEGILQASGPLEAVGMGLRETHSVMLTTYLTFARLFQGTVKVSHLKGPVGIAHTGTLLAGRGFDWLLFFMALISVNLAVINFLPIPIADGGHMVFLIYEQATGKPVSPMVQNIAALVGLALLASVFVIVTFNDLRNLFLG